VIQNDNHVRELISRLEALPTPPTESSDGNSDESYDVEWNDADDEEESEEA
jgi:hypothetical protein